MSSSLRLAHILIVDDNPGDIFLIKTQLKEFKVRVEIDDVQNGIEALRYLRKEAPHQQKTRPDLMLLDVNMPKRNGFEILEEIKGDPNLRDIPVLVLSGTGERVDIERVIRLGGLDLIQKPLELVDCVRIVQALEDVWVDVVVDSDPKR